MYLSIREQVSWSFAHGRFFMDEKKNAWVSGQRKEKTKGDAMIKHALKNSYESQHSALLGMCVTTRGVRPLENPRIPSRRQMTLSASNMPRQ